MIAHTASPVTRSAATAAPADRHGLRARPKGKVETQHRSVRQDVVLACTVRSLDGRNAQLDAWCSEFPTSRVPATTGRLAEEAPSRVSLPAIPCSAVLTVERRITADGTASVAGTPDRCPTARGGAVWGSRATRLSCGSSSTAS